ncbi:class I SAM-dependent DNA methyltransferase [Salinicoccus sp. HZC-1]|uniref:class I SAM-dependent DNA methyltransferase n=1 Tax=Salinicoccus sp. HZC-1 TaxID=3385497 RepID=UPI00398AC1A6
MLRSDSVYKQFSKYYDELTYDMPHELWLDIIHQYKGGRNSVLDIGCGTGNLTRLLDFDEVYGFDQSELMLDEARGKGPGTINYFTGDMRDFELERGFDVICATVDVLNYCKDPEEVMQVFEQVKNHLNEDGVFIFDIHSVFKMENDLNDVTYSDETEHITYIWHAIAGEVPLSVIHDLTFFVQDEESREKYRRFTETHIQRTYKHKDMLKMIDDAGLSVDLAFSDFDLENPVTDVCERIFYVVKKAL